MTIRSVCAGRAAGIFLIATFLFEGIGRCEPRTFTNKNGQKIEAELLDEGGGFIKIRRVGDGKEYVIEVNSLSIEDQAWIANRGKEPRFPGVEGWQELVVHLPTPRDKIAVVGCGSRMASSANGAKEHRLLLPVGAWVRIWIDSSLMPGGYLSHIVRFEGAEKWTFTDEGHRLYLSREDQPRKIVGISPQLGDSDRFFNELDKSELDESICVELPSRSLLPGLASLGKDRVAAFTGDRDFDASSLAKLAEQNPKAIAVVVPLKDVGAIREFDELEALDLMARWPRTDEEKKAFPASEPVLTEFPKVTDLELTNIPYHEELGNALINLGTVRMLDFVWNSLGSINARIHPEWENIAELAPTLESLRLGPRIQARAVEIEKLVGLRFLTLFPQSRITRETNFFLPEDMKELLALDPYVTSVDQEQLQLALAAAYFPKIRRAGGVRLFPMDTVPQLDMLRLLGPNEDGEAQNIRDLESQKELRQLLLSDISQEDLELFSTFPCAGTIQSLSLYDSSFTDLSPLEKFKNLKTLYLHDTSATLKTFDLSRFPSLTRLSFKEEEGFVEIQGLMDHPNLAAISLYDCPNLKTLGRSALNTTLQSVYFTRCAALDSLSTFSGTQALTHIDLIDCDSLDGSLSFLSENPLRDLVIRDCENLPNKSGSDIGK